MGGRDRARLPLNAVTKQNTFVAPGLDAFGRRPQRVRGSRDDRKLGACEDRIAQLGRLIAGIVQRARDRIGQLQPMTAGSSPGTSEIANVTTRAGRARAVSRPPLMAERCLRSVLISPIEAPDLRS